MDCFPSQMGLGGATASPETFSSLSLKVVAYMSWPNCTRQIGYNIGEFHSAFNEALKKRDNCPSPSAKIMADAGQKSQNRDIIDQSKTAICTKDRPMEDCVPLFGALWRTS